ncbi:putative peptidyl-tRNA hydrolase [Mytilus galloprovincialis]|uniref:putative peptidyl-tRNA hydrolase n=1 Tax=Mytilus galloprovincialis TaxID=29158 RepID=UPI003F7C9DCC
MTKFANIFKQSISKVSSFLRQQSENNAWKNNRITMQSTKYLYCTMASGYSFQSQNQMDFMVVGVGNLDMLETRHSVGMQVINQLANHLRVSWTNERKICQGFVAIHTFENQQRCILLKPKVAMNINGRSVQKAVKHYGILPENVYLIHDELDKAVGKYGFKYGGSARGHKGIRSIQQSLQSEDIPRLWVGIDRPVSKSEVADYVLRKFSADERKDISHTLDNCIQALNNEFQKQFGVKLLDTT